MKALQDIIPVNLNMLVNKEVLTTILDNHKNPEVAYAMMNGTYVKPELPQWVGKPVSHWGCSLVKNFNPLASPDEVITLQHYKRVRNCMYIYVADTVGISKSEEIDILDAIPKEDAGKLMDQWVKAGKPEELIIGKLRVGEFNGSRDYITYKKYLPTYSKSGEELISLEKFNKRYIDSN